MLPLFTTLSLSLIVLLPTTIREVDTAGVQAPIDGDTYDFDFVHNYTNYLHGLFRFNSFVIFSHYEARRRPNFLLVRTFEQALLEDFEVPIIVCNLECPIKFRQVIGLNNMVFVQFNSLNDSILKSVDQTLEGLHFITILFFYKHKYNVPPTAAQIHEFFAWCWFRNMINVALTFQVFIIPKNETRNGNLVDKEKVIVLDHVFTYTPFPNITIFNLTDEVAKGRGEFTTDRVRNVNGYVFNTLVYNQVPFVFLTAFSKRCRGQKYCSNSLTGTTGHVYKEFVRKINGTMQFRSVQDADSVLLAAARKEVDIVPHPFSDFVLNTFSSAGSYPIAESKVCIMVPFQRNLEPRYYMLRAYSSQIWLFVLSTAFILFVLELSTSYESSQTVLQWLGLALMSTINLLLNQGHMQISRTTHSKSFRGLHIVIYFMTFVLVGIYGAQLFFILNNPPNSEQIETVRQFLATDLEILATISDGITFFEAGHLPAELIPRLHYVTSEILNVHRFTMNTSFASVASLERWKLTNYQQKHFSQPLLYFPEHELCTSNTFLRFPVQWDSPFTLSLDIFFMMTQESGLVNKWRDMGLRQAKKLNLLRVLEAEGDNLSQLSVEHFVLAICLISSLWLLSFICFCLEIIWFYILGKDLEQLKGQALKCFKRFKCAIMQYVGKFALRVK